MEEFEPEGEVQAPRVSFEMIRGTLLTESLKNGLFE